MKFILKEILYSLRILFNNSRITKSQKFTEKKSNPLFDTDYYLAKNFDVLKSGINPMYHYLNFGIFEGRNPNEYISSDWLTYRYGANAAKVFKAAIEVENESALHCLFDPAYYLQQIGGVKSLGNLTLFDHYLNFGIERGINPNAWYPLDVNFAINKGYKNGEKTNKISFFRELLNNLNTNPNFFEENVFVINNHQGAQIQIDGKISKLILASQNLIALKEMQKVWRVLDFIQYSWSDSFKELHQFSLIKNYPPFIIDSNIDSAQFLNKNKIVIYCHWDAENQVSPWIGETLRWFVERDFGVVFSTNIPLASIPEFIKSYCTSLLQRSNSGYDLESHLLSYNFINNLFEAEQYVFINDSVYFPVSDTKKIEELLLSSNLSPWGLVRSIEPTPHVQSYFLVFNKLHAEMFIKMLSEKLRVWSYLGKFGLINEIEINIEKYFLENDIEMKAIYSSSFFSNPTHSEWELLPYFGVPILKVELLRTFLTGMNSMDPILLTMKLQRYFSDSMISITQMLDHARRVEISRDYLDKFNDKN